MNIYNIKSALMLTLSLLIPTTGFATSTSIVNAWIAEAPPVSKVMAAYMTFNNTGAEAVHVVEATSTDFGKIEFHRTMHENGIASMRRQPELVIPAQGELALKPGGYHMMLFRPARTLRAGDSSMMTFKLKDGSEIQTEVMVKKAAMEESHEHHHHH